MPVYQLLGGAHRHHIPCFVSCAAEVETVKARVAEGWACIRIGIASGTPAQAPRAGSTPTLVDMSQTFEPRLSIANSVEAFTAVREAVGPGPCLGTDYHTRLSVAECGSLMEKLPPGTLDWIEEPIRDESPEAYEELRKLTTVAFAIGEEFSRCTPQSRVPLPPPRPHTSIVLPCPDAPWSWQQMAIFAFHREGADKLRATGYV